MGFQLREVTEVEVLVVNQLYPSSYPCNRCRRLQCSLKNGPLISPQEPPSLVGFMAEKTPKLGPCGGARATRPDIWHVSEITAQAAGVIVSGHHRGSVIFADWPSSRVVRHHVLSLVTPTSRLCATGI